MTEEKTIISKNDLISRIEENESRVRTLDILLNHRKSSMVSPGILEGFKAQRKALLSEITGLTNDYNFYYGSQEHKPAVLETQRYQIIEDEEHKAESIRDVVVEGYLAGQGLDNYVGSRIPIGIDGSYKINRNQQEKSYLDDI